MSVAEPTKGDIFRVVYNNTEGQRKNVLVMATEATEANQYVEGLVKCDKIAVPAMKVATDVHLAPEFFETVEWQEEFTAEELDDQHDDTE